MGGNNVLDRSAMQMIARLEMELPHINEAILKIADELKDTNAAVRNIESGINELCKDQAVQKRDVDSHSGRLGRLEGEVDNIKEKVTVLETKDKIIGGVNAVYTTIVAAVVAIAESLK